MLDITSEVIDLLEKTKREQESFGTHFNVYADLLSTAGACSGDVGAYQKRV